MSSKRHSILPPVSSSGPKAPVSFSSSITIADSAILTGTSLITISSESVVHPRAKLDSLAGRVTIGRRCVVHERTTLGAIGTTGKVTEHAVTLGDYVTVEVGASIEAGNTIIGEGTTVGVACKIGAGAVIGKNCTLTPHSEIAAGETIPDNTVVYSNGLRRPDRRGVADLRNKGQTRQIDVLRRMIPSNPAKFTA
ncbi:trimeric LpxA-like protein [Podospora australis]|uniref:Dynactin subunit 6 n=1 Tax=Podospora australis TaxID=1536484 RepID=A0AAN6WVZ2_9PEZI|nr:trimeric LpxA-like protein [Podospora australis]